MILISTIITLLGLFAFEINLIILDTSMEIVCNLLIISLYVSSIRRFKRAIHEFNHKIPKERAMVIYCYLLALSTLLETVILVCVCANFTALNAVQKELLLDFFNYTHLVLLYFIYKFLTEQKHVQGGILSNQISSIVFITNVRNLIDAIKHELENDELIRQ